MARRPRVQEELERINRPRQILATVDGRAKYVPQVSIAEDILTIIEADLGVARTLEGFLSELAALATMTSASAAQNLNEVRSPFSEAPTPSFKSAYAAKRLRLVDGLLHSEKEAIAGWLHQPYDPDQRSDVCGTCGQPLVRDSRRCSQCGAKVARGVDPKFALRMRCWKQGCRRRDKSIPKFIRVGRSDIEMSHCNECGSKLSEVV